MENKFRELDSTIVGVVSDFQSVISLMDAKAATIFAVSGIFLATMNAPGNKLELLVILFFLVPILLSLFSIWPRKNSRKNELSWIAVARLDSEQELLESMSQSPNLAASQAISLAKICAKKSLILRGSIISLCCAIVFHVFTSTVSISNNPMSGPSTEIEN